MDFFYRYKKIIITAIILLCFGTITISANRFAPTFVENALSYLIVPFQKINSTVSVWVKDKFNTVNNITEITEENSALKERVLDLESEVKRLKLIEKENQSLSELLKTDQKYKNYPKIGARIIAKDPGNWYNIFIIDKGSSDGLSKNMVVMSSNGLVGKILEAGYNYSKVVSIIDDTDSVSAQSLRTGDLGFIRGDLTNQGSCKMEYIDNTSEIIEGDEVVTSHLSNIYPPGLTIGYIKQIYTDANTLTKYAEVTPAVDFKHLDTVLIITQNFEKNIDSSSLNEASTENQTIKAGE